MLIRNLYSLRNAPQQSYREDLEAGIRNALFHCVKRVFAHTPIRNVDPEHALRSTPHLDALVKEFCTTHLMDYFSENQKSAYVWGYESYDYSSMLIDLDAWIIRASEAQLFDLLEFLFQRLREDGWSGRAQLLASQTNQLFEREMIAHQMLDGQIVNRSDQYLHQEVVEGAVVELKAAGFEKAQQDFMEALKAQADGHPEDAITAANAALESTMKKLLDTDKGDAKELIQALINKGVIPGYLKNGMQALPVIRNEDGDAHGATEVSDVPQELAQYAIHLAGANIVFLITRAKTLGLLA